MKHTSGLTLLFAALGMATAVAAETAPSLPASATKLTGKQITALYEGSTVKWHNYAIGGTGTATYDLKDHSQTGTWNMGGKSGKFTGTIRVKGDTFCYKTGKDKEVCGSVYTDGSDIYEVNSKGVVVSKNQKS